MDSVQSGLEPESHRSSGQEGSALSSRLPAESHRSYGQEGSATSSPTRSDAIDLGAVGAKKTIAESLSDVRDATAVATRGMVRKTVELAEDRMCRQLRRLQLDVNEVRELTLSFLEQRTVQVEKQVSKLERNCAKISGNCTGLSEEMQALIRHCQQLDSRLTSSKRQREDDLRSKCMELELQLQKVANCNVEAVTRMEESLGQVSQHVHILEARVEASMDHAAPQFMPAHIQQTLDELPQLHERMRALEVAGELQPSLAIHPQATEDRLQSLEAGHKEWYAHLESLGRQIESHLQQPEARCQSLEDRQRSDESLSCLQLEGRIQALEVRRSVDEEHVTKLTREASAARDCCADLSERLSEIRQQLHLVSVAGEDVVTNGQLSPRASTTQALAEQTTTRELRLDSDVGNFQGGTVDRGLSSFSPSSQHEPSDQVDHVALICHCGNQFMPDADFCRKCGIRRLEVEVDKQIPAKRWDDVGDEEKLKAVFEQASKFNKRLAAVKVRGASAPAMQRRKMNVLSSQLDDEANSLAARLKSLSRKPDKHLNNPESNAQKIAELASRLDTFEKEFHGMKQGALPIEAISEVVAKQSQTYFEEVGLSNVHNLLASQRELSSQVESMAQQLLMSECT